MDELEGGPGGALTDYHRHEHNEGGHQWLLEFHNLSIRILRCNAIHDLAGEGGACPHGQGRQEDGEGQEFHDLDMTERLSASNNLAVQDVFSLVRQLLLKLSCGVDDWGSLATLN